MRALSGRGGAGPGGGGYVPARVELGRRLRLAAGLLAQNALIIFSEASKFHRSPLLIFPHAILNNTVILNHLKPVNCRDVYNLSIKERRLDLDTF